MGKGSAAERELSNILEDQYDYAALRCPSSGRGTTRNRPDLIAVKGTVLDVHGDGLREVSECYVIEAKARPDGTATFDREKIMDLQEYASRAGAIALVAVKPDRRLSEHDQWYLCEVTSLHETPEGNYSIRKQDHAECLSISEVFGE